MVVPPTPAGRFMTFGLTTDARPRDVAARLAKLPIDDRMTVGIGAPLARALGADIPGLHDFVAISGPGGAFPSTQGALWFFLGGTDPGEILHRARKLRRGHFQANLSVIVEKYEPALLAGHFAKYGRLGTIRQEIVDDAGMKQRRRFADRDRFPSSRFSHVDFR